MLDKKIREDFPVLINNPSLCYLDSGASSLKLGAVIEKMVEYYTIYGVNIHRGVYKLSTRATEEYEETRELVAKFINAQVNEIVFTKGASNGLNMVATMVAKDLAPGDEIIVSELEHHSSLLPWQHLAKAKGCQLRFVPLDQEGRIKTEAVRKILSNKTKVIALTYVSNVLGYITPVKEIAALARSVNALFVVDAAQAAPHLKIDVKALDVDFLAFSAHKMLGPTGFGILYGKYKLLNKYDPVEFGGDMNDDVGFYQATYREVPYKYEAGTQPIAEAIAFKEAIRYLLKIGMAEIEDHETALVRYAVEKLQAIPGVKLYNPHTDTGILAFNLDCVHPHDVATILDERQIALRAGHHCAQLVSNWLKCQGTLRATFYLYNTREDVERLADALKAASDFFGGWN